MRLLLLCSLLLLLASPALAQIGPYQWNWVGATTATFTGNGNGGGFIAMTTECRTEFGEGARMCTSAEILASYTLDLAAIPPDGCWIQATVVPSASAGSIDQSIVSAGSCTGWRGLGATGLTIEGANGATPGAFASAGCSTSRAIGCCKPTSVPAPTSSLSLPVGAAALAGLSLLKGGA